MRTFVRYLSCCLAAGILLACCGCDDQPESAAAAAAPVTPAAQYAAFVLRSCDQVEKRIPEFTKLAEQVADRHLAGGVLGVIWEPPSATGPQGPQYEIKGRSGGLSAFDVSLPKLLKEADREKDVAIIGWQRDPDPQDLEILRKYRERFFIIAFGPRELPSLAEHVKLCDAWIDTGLGADDRMAALADGTTAGQGNALVNTLNAWAFQGELVAALTRKGKMPTLLKSHMWEDSQPWNERYRSKLRFHDDLEIAPVAAGVLGRAYLEQIRGLVKAFTQTQQPAVTRTVELIVEELRQGRKTIVAQTGHTTYEVVGKYEDAAWASPMVLYDTAGRIKQYQEVTPDGALVLRLGYSGADAKLVDVLRQKQQRIIFITTTKDPRPTHQIPQDLLAVIDTGFDFGDACVQIEGYPIRVFPPSGVMQLFAYQTVNVEVLSRLAAQKIAPADPK